METSEEILEMINGLNNTEKWKLLSLLFDEYYNKGSVPRLENPEDILEY